MAGLQISENLLYLESIKPYYLANKLTRDQIQNFQSQRGNPTLVFTKRGWDWETSQNKPGFINVPLKTGLLSMPNCTV